MLFMRCHLTVICLIIICFTWTFASNKVKFGFKVTRIEPCQSTVHKLESNLVSVKAEVRDTGKYTYKVDINYNVSRAIGPVVFAFRTFRLQKDGQMKLLFKTKEVSCKSPFATQLTALERNIDQNCMMAEGVYWIRDLDLDKFSWIWTKTASPGTAPVTYVFDSEHIVGNVCIYCVAVYAESYNKK